MALRLYLPRASANLQAFQSRKSISVTNACSSLLSATQAFQARKSFSGTNACLPMFNGIAQHKAIKPQQFVASHHRATNLAPFLPSNHSVVLHFPALELPSFLEPSEIRQTSFKTGLFRSFGETFLTSWHTLLSLQRQSSASWYMNVLREETLEFEQAVSYVDKLSEESDLFFILSRSRFDKYPIGALPSLISVEKGLFRNVAVYAYMVGKYSGRWIFYRVVARVCGKEDWRSVNEVINPTKGFKLRTVASRHGVDQGGFERVAKRLLRVWPLLP